MTGRSRPALAVTAVLIIALGALNAWRAATQSFTIDESYAYRDWTTKSTGVIFGTFHSSHHVLFTVLSKLSRNAFGVSEFTLRLPTVLAGWVFLVLLAVIGRRLYGEWGGLLAFATVATNPLVLDHLSCARGYGLGLTFLSGGMVLLAEPTTARLIAAGICLGLSVSSNLTFLFPSTALILAAVVAYRRLVPLAVPFAVAAAVFLAGPILRTGSMDLDFGNNTLEGTFDSIVNISIPESGLLRDVGRLLATGLVWLGMVGVAVMWRKDRWSPLVRGAAPLTLLLVVAAHYVFGVKYPFTRTGIYFIPLILLAAAAPARFGVVLKWIACAAGLAIVTVHLAAFRIDHYGDWKSDADNKAIAREVQSSLRTGVQEKLCVSWPLESGLSFYREKLRIPIPPLVRNDLGPECTIFALLPEDEELTRHENLRTIYRGPVSGALVAVRRDSIIAR